MNHLIYLAPLGPVLAGLVTGYLMSRDKRTASTTASEGGYTEVQVFKYPRGILKVCLAGSILFPLGLFLLPDSLVQDTRALGNVIATCFAFALLGACAYMYKFKIIVERDILKYGAFFTTSVDLRRVTAIKYYWVGDGISLKLFDHNKRIAIFEGNIENFDAFAKAVRRCLPAAVHVETVGKASF